MIHDQSNPFSNPLPQKSSKNEVKPKVHTLKCATINYCGIMNNPFEFYSSQNQSQLEKISKIFEQRIKDFYSKQVQSGKFGWNLGKIQQKVRIGRYSPSFHLKTGIQKGQFLNFEQFKEQWDVEFDKLKQSKVLKYTSEQKENTKIYDFIYYQTLLTYVYGQHKFEELIKNNSQEYVKKLSKFFDQSFLNQQKKLIKFREGFQILKADVTFFQEYSPLLQKQFANNQKYFVSADPTKDTLIVAKRSAFKQQLQTEKILSNQLIKSLNIAERTSFLILDNIILINEHLSSKADKNLPQIAELKKALVNLRVSLPNFNVIVGGDLNSFLSYDQEFKKHFQIYPQGQHEITTVKKRTMAQAQFKKGNILVQESKDKIISNFPIKDHYISYINGHKINKDSLVPSDDHPFDHFVVVAEIEIPQ